MIKDHEWKGIVETTEVAGKVHKLPYREVVRLEKQTTKIRIVFDVAAKRDGPLLPLFAPVHCLATINKSGALKKETRPL